MAHRCQCYLDFVLNVYLTRGQNLVYSGLFVVHVNCSRSVAHLEYILFFLQHILADIAESGLDKSTPKHKSQV